MASRQMAPSKDQLKRHIKHNVPSNIRAVSCPVHGRAPTNIRPKSAAPAMTWEYEVCCDALHSEIGRRLS